LALRVSVRCHSPGVPGFARRHSLAVAMLFHRWGLAAFLIAVPYSILYAVVTRLPMVYAMVHMIYALELGGAAPPIIFVSYCIARLLAAVSVSSFFGMPAMLIGTLCGVVAHTGILIDQDSALVFGAMVAISGFAETVTGIDVLLKLEAFVKDLRQEEEQLLFRLHLISATCGSFIAYAAGGWLYAAHHVAGVAWAGLAASLLACLVLLAYGLLRPQFCGARVDICGVCDVAMQEDSGPGSEATGDRVSQRSQRLSQARASQASRRSLGSARHSRLSAALGGDPLGLQQLKDELAAESKLERAPTSRELPRYESLGTKESRRVRLCGWTVVLSFFVTPMPVGENFAILSLYWRQQWQQSTAAAGWIMAIGEALGLCALVPLASERLFRSPLTRPFRKPASLVLASAASSVCVVLVLAPNIILSAAGAAGVHIVNVLLHSFCAEVAAAWIPVDVYAMWVGRCYLAKRASNATMAFVCTMLYQYAGPRAPFATISGTVFVWAFVLAGVYWSLRLMPCQAAKSGLTERPEWGAQAPPEHRDSMCSTADSKATEAEQPPALVSGGDDAASCGSGGFFGGSVSDEAAQDSIDDAGSVFAL